MTKESHGSGWAKALVPAGIAAIIAITIAVWQGNDLRDQINQLSAQTNALIEQNRIQGETLEEQKKIVTVLNKTLDATREGLAKKSFIDVVVVPHVPREDVRSITVTHSASDGLITVSEPEISAEYGDLILSNPTASFDILVSNFGTNGAFIERYTVNVIPNSEVLTALGVAEENIATYLKPGEGPITIPLEFNVTKDFAPSGEIVFKIYHNSNYEIRTYQYQYAIADR
ncbi:hypothetical protein [Nitrososphaera sp.]|uniref:hypothetical protein n=1 Tax=Nitrososphaera sp. TaxID=1971748 RepID=UPI0017AB39DA|nr:hypothetical protein [Nitrososphaera sp.]NWG36713.1 hypothetical protein [Nitrososphaera sp.]